MAYRGIKCSDPFISKTSRNERFAQMSKQEQIIQQKKMEIQAKMEEVKAKQAVESVKKPSSSNNSSTTVTKTTPIPKKEDEKPNSSSVPTVNLFANDGSFLDQFKKISNNKPKQESSPLIPVAVEVEKREDKIENRSYDNNSRERRWNGDKNRDWDSRRDTRRRSESRWGRSSDRCRSSSSSPSPPRHRSSASGSSAVDSRRNNNYHHHHHHHSSGNSSRNQFNQCPPPNINQQQSSSNTSNMLSRVPPPSSPIIHHQMTTHLPPPNMRNAPAIHNHHNSLPPSLLTDNNNDNNNYHETHGINTRMPLPPPPPPPPLHMIRPPIRALPPNTNVPPPGINIQNSTVSLNCQAPPPVPVQQPQHIINQQAPCNIPPICPVQPPSVPPPTLLPPMSQMPPNMMTINQQIVPPPSLMMSGPPPPLVHNVSSSSSSTINTVPPPNLNIPPPSVTGSIIIQSTGPPPPAVQSQSSSSSQSAHLLPTSYPTIGTSQVQLSGASPNLQIPSLLRMPSNLTADHSGHSCPVEAEQLARIVADCGDAIEQEVREKNSHDPKLWFLHQKQSTAYQQYRGLVSKYRNEKAEIESTKRQGSGADLYSPEDALSDNDEFDKLSSHNPSQSDNSREESREERKRKRRSRWSEPDNKVITIQQGVSIPPVQSSIPPSLHIQSSPGISRPPPLGHGLPKIQNTKVKNPMLTRVSRSDPALLNYARQTYGTLDLSDEQWKKAEDHYKINLLYQNLLKKREELKRLEAQGKHKYEYDSDEETEGGTWEHKLRSAEMEATQMWAEELTAQADSKHHIGDFLPPEELKKFMEHYSALKQGKEPDLSDYKEFKLKEDNIGFQMLQKLGWSEGQGLGSEGSGRVEPINKATSRLDSAGLGSERPDGISRDDDEFDAYRKRMMLAYRFRPNPLNNPRRPYY